MSDDEMWQAAMKSRPKTLAWLAPLVLAACAGHSVKPSAGTSVSPQLRSSGSELRTYQILNWVAPDDRTLLLTALNHSLFQARFRRRCPGLQLADTIAFSVPSPPQVEKYSGIVLPDGTVCAFAALTPLVSTPPKLESHNEPANQ